MGLTDSSGNKVNSYDYDPFGVMLNQQEGVTNPFKFAGGYLDASGFEQFGVRYYSPSLGRWTQQDPLAGSLFDLNSANRYVYAGNDPVNQVDPSGRFSLTIGCISTIVGLGWSFITAVQSLIAAAQGWLGLAAFAAALSTGPAGWIIYLVTIGVTFIITAALAVGYYEGVAAACGLPAIP